MAFYKNGSALSQSLDPRFDAHHKPGSTVPYSGIYICVNCRDEIACNHGDPFPPQNHRQHPNTQKPIAWQLLVQTQKGP